MEVVKLTKEHLDAIEPGYDVAMSPAMIERVTTEPMNFAFVEGGKPWVCCGIKRHWAGRGEAWAIFNKGCMSKHRGIMNCAHEVFDMIPYKRIEAVVDCDFKFGHKWIKKFGFELEAERMKCYGRRGEDVSLYARVGV